MLQPNTLRLKMQKTFVQSEKKIKFSVRRAL